VSLIKSIKSYSEGIQMSEEKKQLLDSFFLTGFPTTKDEDWKYTSLKKIISNDYVIENESDTKNYSVVEKYSLKFKYRIIFFD